MPRANVRTQALPHAAAIFGAALMFLWPAIYNRYPLLYPDSISYLDDGRAVARALFLHQFSDHYGMRSLLYSLGILPFHWNATPWPVVAMQSLLVAYVIWLVVRSVTATQARLAPQYLALSAALGALTSLPWFTSLVMPDVLGSLLYLCLHLLAFARESLSRHERLAVALIAWWCATAHATHLVIAGGLCLLYFAIVLLWRARLGNFVRGARNAAVVVLVALISQVALNAYLTRTFSLNAEAPPYLVARILADGPGRWYLQQHCAAPAGAPRRFTLCDYAAKISEAGDNGDEFLWGPAGVWATAPDEAKEQIRREQHDFIWAALREYPRAQIAISLSHFWRQLGVFGVYVFDANTWMQDEIENVLPGQSVAYFRSLQAHDALPLDFFSDVLQRWTIIGSLGIVALAAFVAPWRRRISMRVLVLGITIISTVLANAFVTGVFSSVEDRYESRVIWLIPLLAGVFVLAGLNRSALSTGENRATQRSGPGR